MHSKLPQRRALYTARPRSSKLHAESAESSAPPPFWHAASKDSTYSQRSNALQRENPWDLGITKRQPASGQLENRTENEVRLIMQFYFQPSVPHCSSSMLSLCHLVNNSNIHQLSNCSPFFCEVISHRCSRRFASLAGTEVTSPGAKASFAQLNGPMASRCNCRSGSPKAWNIRRTTRFRPSASCTWT